MEYSQNISSQNSSHIFSQSMSKTIKNTMYFKIYFILIFIITPLTFIQKFFLLNSHPHTLIYSNQFVEFMHYIRDHNLLWTHMFFLFFMGIFLFIYLRPINQYIKYGTHEEITKQKILNPTQLILLVILASSLTYIIGFIIKYNYYLELSILSNIYNILYSLSWQVILSYILIYTFLDSISDLRESLKFYKFEQKDLKFYSVHQDLFFLIAQIIMIILIILETVNLINQGAKINAFEGYYTNIASWSNILFFIGIGITVFMLIFHQRRNQKLRLAILHEVEELVTFGNLAHQTTYYTQDKLGYFISEYNTFISSLRCDLTKVLDSTNQLHKSNSILYDNAEELISVLDSQEAIITSINSAANSTNKTIQKFSDEVHIQYTNLNNELTSIEKLISGTDNIISVFKDIKLEHQQSQQSSVIGLKAVKASLDKSLLMHQRIQEITDKIREAGQETEGIDEVLKVIKNISEQTNLLSMSAAIEAAHGGNSGHGFAMVANEVRKLANMSHNAVDRISSRLSSITYLIRESFEISLQSLELAESNSRISRQLNEAMETACNGSLTLTKITEEAGPITEKQGIHTKEFKKVILEVLEFLQYIQNELRKESATAVTMSLNFNTMINNSKKVYQSLYKMNNTLESLSITEQQLNDFTLEFSLDENRNCSLPNNK